MKTKNKRMLVAVDGSRQTMDAVRYVSQMAGPEGTRVVLLHVIRNMNSASMEPWAQPTGDDLATELSDTELNNAKQTMVPVFARSVQALRKGGVGESRISVKLITGVATRGGTIYAQALHGGFGSIAAGRRGLSNVERFALGRVSNKVVQLAEYRAV